MVVRLSALRNLEQIIRTSAWVHASKPRAACFRQNATAAQSNPPPPSARKKSLWIPITVIALAAGGIGTYVRYYQTDSTVLNPTTFTKYKLVSKTPVSSTCSIFTLRPVTLGRNYEVYEEAWSKGLWSVQFKQPQLQVGRDYTPLPPIYEDELSIDDAVTQGDNLHFLIRREPAGEVSGYLHSLRPGATLEFRGPQMDYQLPNDVQEILFIAGGTGIAPALQAAHTIFRERQLKDARMHIIWANRRREDCVGGKSDLHPAVSESWWSRVFSGLTSGKQDTKPGNEQQSVTVSLLEELKRQSRGRVSVDYYVDEENTLINKEAILGFTEKREISQSDGRAKRRLILISGPDGFISFLAGPKLWRNGIEEQGPLQGLLKQLDLKDWAVWKL